MEKTIRKMIKITNETNNIRLVFLFRIYTKSYKG